MGWIDSTKISLVSDMLDGIGMYFLQELSESAMAMIIELFLSSFLPTATYFYGIFDMVKVNSSFVLDAFGRGDGSSYLNCVYAAMPIMYYLAAITLMLLFVFHLIIACTGPLTSIEKKDEVSSLCVRFFITAVLIASCKWFYTQIAMIAEELIKLSVTLNLTDFTQNTDLNLVSGIIFAILTIVLKIVLIFDFVKFMLDIIEKYILAQVLICTAPAAAATFVSKASSQVLKNHFIMYLSTLLNLFLGHIFLGLFARGMSSSGILSGPVNTIFMISFIKLGLGLSNIIKALGMNTAQTGMNLLNSISLSGLGLLNMARLATGLGRGVSGVVGGAAGMAANQAVKNGDLGLFGMANSVRSATKGQDTTTTADNVRAFSQAGGFTSTSGSGNPINTDAKRASVDSSVAEFMRSGDYRSASMIPAQHQTGGIKKSFMENGTDAFRDATGLNSSEISQAHLKNNGDISGMVNVKDSMGNSYSAGFSASPENIGKTNMVMEGSDGVKRGVRFNMDSDTLTNMNGASFTADYKNMKPGERSVLATLTGARVNPNAMKARNVTTEKLNGRILEGYDANGKRVSMYHLDTGKSSLAGIHDTSGSGKNKTEAFNPMTIGVVTHNDTCQDLLDQYAPNTTLYGGKLHAEQIDVTDLDKNGDPIREQVFETRYPSAADMATGITKPWKEPVKDSNGDDVWINKTHKEYSGNYYAEYQDAGTVYRVDIKNPTAGDLANKKSNIVDFGGRFGTKTVSIQKKRQSNELSEK